MSSNRIKEFQLGDMVARYIFYSETNCVGFELIPVQMRDQLVASREILSGTAVDNFTLFGALPARYSGDSLLQLKLLDEPYGDGFSAGMTLFQSSSAAALCFDSQEVFETDGMKDIQTVLVHPRGLRCIHHVIFREGDLTLDVFCEVLNESDSPVTLELLSSFVLNGISPFDESDAAEKVKLHHFRSWWSAEGRRDSHLLEELHLERPWVTHGVRVERFGQVGSMPVRKFFPFVAAEDISAGVIWGAKLAWAGSWQMEAIRRGDTLTLTGGHADREFGHWKKTLVPGETLESPRAMLSCSSGTIDDFCQRFVKTEEARIPDIESEHSLPVVFNEWCTSWGMPKHDGVLAAANRLTGLPVRYFVIDAGWSTRPAGSSPLSNGDWTVDQVKFPNGLKAVADALKEQGLIPGLWFEFEICTPESDAWNKTEHHLYKDGVVLQVGTRRFWNFCNPWVQEYLSEKVIGLLRDGGFRYLKVDYNDAIGIGCDHSDSLGEGLRQQILAVQAFFRKLRQAIPDLVIENCSSGGHRLEPSMMQLASMGSFSDAHEGEEIPIIASNLQRLIPPRQSQIWAVLRKGDSNRRLVYSLAAGCLGRLCISGDIGTLSEEQMQVVRHGLEFYHAAAPIIKSGWSQFFGEVSKSYNHPRGWQAVVRYDVQSENALVVVHGFEIETPLEINLPLLSGDWRIVKTIACEWESCPDFVTERLVLQMSDSFSAKAFILQKRS